MKKIILAIFAAVILANKVSAQCTAIVVNPFSHRIDCTGAAGAAGPPGPAGAVNSINTDATADQTLTKTNDTNVTLAIVDNAAGDHKFNLGWTGSLAVPRGGTGATSFTSAHLLLGGGAGALTALAFGTANQMLGMNAGATAYEHKTLIAGTSMTITHGVGSITFDAGTPTFDQVGAGTNANALLVSGSLAPTSPGTITANLYTGDSTTLPSNLMTFLTSTGTPGVNCTAGKTQYLQTDGAPDFFGCSATNTWRKILSTTNSGQIGILGATGTTPATPAAGFGQIYFGSASMKYINESAVESTTVKPDAGTTHQVFTALSSVGVLTKSQLACADLSNAGSGCSGTASGPANICYADAQVGVDLSNKVIACDTANGVTIDARGFNSAQNWATAWTLAHNNVHVILPPVTVTVTVTEAIKITGSNNDISQPGGKWLRGGNSLILFEIGQSGSFGSAIALADTSGSNIELNSSVTTGAGLCSTLAPVNGSYIWITDVGTNNGVSAHQELVRAGSGCSTDTFTVDGALHDSFYAVATSTARKLAIPPSGNYIHDMVIDGAYPTFTDSFYCAREVSSVFNEWNSVTFQNCDASSFFVNLVYGSKFDNLTITDSGNTAAAALAAQVCTECSFNNITIDLMGKTSGFATNFLALHGSNVENMSINNGGSNGRGFKTTNSTFNHYVNIHVTSVGTSGGGWVCFKMEHSDRHNTYANLTGVNCPSNAMLFSENSSYNLLTNVRLQGGTAGAVGNAIDVTTPRQIKQSGLTVTPTNLTATTGTFRVTAGMASLNWAQPTGSLGDYYNTVGPDNHGMIFCFSGFADAGNNSCFQVTSINASGDTVTVSSGTVIVTHAATASISMVGFYSDDGNVFNGFEFSKMRGASTPFYVQLTGNDWTFSHGTIYDDQGHTSGGFNWVQPPNYTAGQTVYQNLRTHVEDVNFSGLPANSDIVLSTQVTDSMFSRNTFGSGVTAGSGTGVRNRFLDNKGTRPACDATSGPILRGSNWFVEAATDTMRWCSIITGTYNWNIPQ